MVLYLNKLEFPSLHPRMLCANLGWNWLSGSGKESFLISSMYFRYFIIISPWKRAGSFFEQTWIPFTKGCSVSSFVWIGPVVSDTNIFKFLQMYFSYFVIISPGKGCGPSFRQSWIPITQGCFVPCLVEIDPLVLEKIIKFRQCVFVIS